MIEPRDFLAALAECDIRFVTGVPDSLLKDVCAAMSRELPAERHVIAANEGAAAGMAIGHYLATGRPALVYLQNSGLGNLVNPLTSLVDPAVYGIPMVLMVGWRGEILPDGRALHDEPQHVTQGRLTLPQLDLLGIPYVVVNAETNIGTCLAACTAQALSGSRAVALVVRKQSFAPARLDDRRDDDQLLTRELAIEAILEELPDDVAIVATTGMASRELFELRKRDGAGHARDFLTVGGMGHALSIASGIALAQPQRKVVCLDGDGAMLMHLGALTNSATVPNLLHVMLNNGAHDSVGGQPTRALHLSLGDIARSCGYPMVEHAEQASEIRRTLQRLLDQPRSAFLEVRCKRGARSNLGRPDRTPAENKGDFMQFLGVTAA